MPFDSFTGVVPSTTSGRRDRRKIYVPVEIPAAFQTGLRRFQAERPATIEAQRRREQSGNGFVAESSSYFPKIRESQTARDSREQKAKFVSGVVFMDRTATKQRLLPRHSHAVRPGKATKVAQPLPTSSQPQLDRSGPASIVANLDQSGMAALHRTFEKYEQLNEEEFILEMLAGLNAATLPRTEQVELTCEISTIFRKADTRSEGLLNWVDFSTFITQTSDIRTVDGDNITCKYQVETAPPPLNMTAEIERMVYLLEIDKILFHDNKRQGFSILDPATNTVVKETTRSAGHVLDALYSPFGRYVVTATTLPVISLYDIDSLKIRQQIPTQTAQLALANHSSATSSTQLYSSCTHGQVHAWDLETLTRSHTFFEKGHPVMNNLLVLDGMSQVASACLDGKIYMIDLHLHRVTKVLSGHKRAVTMLRYSSENGYLVSAGLDKSVQVWNPHVEQKIGSLTGHRAQLIGMEAVPNMPHIITADESGVVKIWDLRKFAAFQTIAKELYVKDHSIPRTLTRPMRSLCYISSKKRIAVAHSAIFFIDQVPTTNFDSKESQARAASAGPHEQVELEESKKPIAVFYYPPTQCFLTLTGWEITSWDASTGQLARSTSPVIGSEMTCACLVDDSFSCFVGTECGIIARLMIPNGSAVIQRRVHSAEVTEVLWLKEKRQVISSAMDGNILISRYDSLDVVFKLNHWRGVQSVSSAFFSDGSPSTAPCPEYSVPLTLRAFFYGNEIERLMRIFGQADKARSGSIPLSKLPEVLEAAFPITFLNRNGDSSTTESSARILSGGYNVNQEMLITFTSLLEILKESLTALQDGKVTQSQQGSISSVSCLAVHSDLNSLVSGSSTDGTFCAWNIRNSAVIAQGIVGGEAKHSHQPKAPPSSISQIEFLNPDPYFVCLEVGTCKLQFWSTVAIPPQLPHSYQRFLRFTHRLRAQPSSEDEKKATNQISPSFFLTEAELSRDRHEKDQDQAANQAEEFRETTILAVKWFSGGGDSEDQEKLLCVGDEKGYITIYDLELALHWLEAIKESSHTSQDTTDGGLLPTDCLRVLHQWHAHRSTAIRSLEVFRIDELHGNTVIVASMTENGCISLWSLDGELLGRLNERPPPPVSRNRLNPRVPTVASWKLRVDGSAAKSKEVTEAERILHKVEHKLRRPRDDQSAEKSAEQQQQQAGAIRRNTMGDAPTRQSPRVTSRLLSVSSIRSPMIKFSHQD